MTTSTSTLWRTGCYLILAALAVCLCGYSSCSDVSTISVGPDYDACAIRTDGTVQCWGKNLNGQPAVSPSGTFTQVSTGLDGSCGLRTDYTIACWGSLYHYYDSPPSGTFIDVSVGDRHACAIRYPDYGVQCWGDNSYHQASPPAGQFYGISAGTDVTCGLKSDLTLACWGGFDPSFKVTNPPQGQFQLVTAGGMQACALRSDYTLACWGNYGNTTAPSGQFYSVVSWDYPRSIYSYYYNCGIRTDQTVACWYPGSQQTWGPSGTFARIDVGKAACGVRTDGTVDCFYTLMYPNDPRIPPPDLKVMIQ